MRGRVAIILAAFLFVASCSSGTSTSEWTSQWEAVLEQIPTVDTMLAADDASLRVICSETVGDIRGAATEMKKAPNADIERAALTFVDFAEAVFFDCPIPNGEHAGFPAGYQEMNRLIAVVDALIAFDEG